MVSSDRERALRSLVRAFPPLKLALAINDFICRIFKQLCRLLVRLLRYIFNVIYTALRGIFRQLIDFIQILPGSRQFISSKVQYKQVKPIRTHNEPIPYRDDRLRRSITYQGGIILGALMYIFLYFVLVKHHTYTTIAVAVVLMLAYLIILENSHNIRSILMLCLPIMFTNRGRALVFCSMLAILIRGPISNAQMNVKQLQSSLECSKQYILVSADKYVDKNVVRRMMRLEDLIKKLVANIKVFISRIEEKAKAIYQVAILIEQHIVRAINRLREMVDICNKRTDELVASCHGKFNRAYRDCLGGSFSFIYSVACDIVSGTSSVCDLPSLLCSLPESIVRFLDATIGRQFRTLVQAIGNELYVDIDVKHEYLFNETKSKSYQQVSKEITYDVDRKFWYVHVVARVFNMISLILVTWILCTATIYHMHYLTESSYDNMYLDQHLRIIDELRRVRQTTDDFRDATKPKIFSRRDASLDDKDDDDDRKRLIDFGPDKDDHELDKSRGGIQVDSIRSNSGEKYLFPMYKAHERKYLKPFSFTMNTTELHKLYVAGFVWLIINGYIAFFTLLDYILYLLICFINETLKDVLFSDELPLISVETKTPSGEQVSYNRTYLRSLRLRSREQQFDRDREFDYANSSVGSFYRNLMTSLEGDIPDEVEILESLEGCLPMSQPPPYGAYKTLLLLAVFTFGAVIVEAYALRTRHCIANLYYPRRARQRAVWLYRKLLNEKPKYREDTQDGSDDSYLDKKQQQKKSKK